MPSDHSRLLEAAATSVDANIIDTDIGQLLTAGAHQFRTLWTRDFCFSIPGLLTLGRAELVERQLRTLFSYQRRDGLIPRGLDVVNPKRRVVLALLPALPDSWTQPTYVGKALRAEYLGEHKTPAIDSNVLAVLGLCDLARHTGDDSLIQSRTQQIVATMEYYRQYVGGGLVHQPKYSDWQDSANRSGPGLYLHVLIGRTLTRLSQFGIELPWLADLVHRSAQQFYDPHRAMFRQAPQSAPIPLEANLWIVEDEMFGHVADPNAVFARLVEDPLWRMLGVPVYPEYPSAEVSLTTKAVGLRHYHDGFRWSWLMAEAARISALRGAHTEAHRILTQLESLVLSRNRVAEIYEPSRPTPVARPLYRSEIPFSWGAAKTVEAIAAAGFTASPGRNVR